MRSFSWVVSCFAAGSGTDAWGSRVGVVKETLAGGINPRRDGA